MLTRRDVALIAGLLALAVGVHLGALGIAYRYEAPEQAERVVTTWAASPVARKALGIAWKLERRLDVVEAVLPNVNATLSAAITCTDAIEQQLSEKGGFRKRITDALAAQEKLLRAITDCTCPAGIK